jgi:hypothetical protein
MVGGTSGSSGIGAAETTVLQVSLPSMKRRYNRVLNPSIFSMVKEPNLEVPAGI